MKLIWILSIISALIIYAIYLYFVKKSNHELEQWEKSNLNLDDALNSSKSNLNLDNITKSTESYPKTFAGIKASNLPMFIFLWLIVLMVTKLIFIKFY
ncbi:hypothetical protein BKK52_07830 [Rodentibacter trehalosifermentans]|uniref:Uncharacterized protein n=1 Tax=Rodentibacter trehalosifermentans TaxID=1908263 RepID=A0A1V3IZV7_9PAST|nr:hypothetical protein [Rodentibacter trehalosifermentans]OOF47818.1 hypothetical protein BKK52_07830 [Rodentibacter trehalosifermentans]